MDRENDIRVVKYWQITDFYYFAKFIRAEGIDDDDITEGKYIMPIHVGAHSF